MRWFPGASLVEINLPSHHPASTRPRKQKPRGRIKEWSANSRSRLKHTLGRLQREELGRVMIVTLTYPKECPAPDDHKVYKDHLHRFNLALRRRWPLCSGIWKLEFQTRGAAHYHYMLFGLSHEPVEQLRTWMRQTWYRIAHNGDQHLGSAAVEVDPIRKVGGAMGYFAKYLGKGDQTMPGNFTGRYWGKVNAARLPVATAKELEVPPKMAAMIRRIARKKMQHDVTTARWNRHLEHLRQSGWELSRLQWQTAKGHHHGGASRVAAWTTLPAMLHTTEDGITATFTAMAFRMRFDREHFALILQQHPPPPRWKPRHNDRVRLLCDASRFVGQLARLHQPGEGGGFRAFSRKG